MSRLIDKLDKSNKTSSQPMGFRATRDDLAESKIILIAGVKTGTTDEIKDCTTGADAVLLRASGASQSAKSVQAAVKSLPEIPCGLNIENIGKTKIDSYIQSGCDFLVFPAESPVNLMPQDEKTGKLLLVDPLLDDSLVRVINSLPVDAVITTELSKAGEAITWRHLMAVQRMVLLLSKPVIIPVSSGISSGELKAIWDADIDGILVEASTGEPGRIEEIRQAIKKLPPRSAKQHGKSDVLLPHTSSATESITPDEDDDYE